MVNSWCHTFQWLRSRICSAFGEGSTSEGPAGLIALPLVQVEVRAFGEDRALLQLSCLDPLEERVGWGGVAGRFFPSPYMCLPFSDDDSWDLVTCFCMKPFAGRPMIECNECHTWIHLSCAKIRKSNVPEVFVCQKCRDSKFDIRRSNRSRMGSRKLFLD